MPEILVATPLKIHSVHQQYSFSKGVSIQQLSPILWSISIVKGFISEREREELDQTPYWLCVSRIYENSLGDVGDELYDEARHAAWALQIICPTGAKNIFLKFQRTSQGYDNIGAHHPRELCSTLMGRLIRLEDQGLTQHFDVVYEGVRRAFKAKIVRLQNPIQLLEHGMQICNPNLGALMFVMGLDMLFMAGEINTFVKRAGGFLGVRTLIFPKDSIMHYQPSTTVGEVVSALYQFRNIIGHGQEIPKTPYREQIALLSTTGQQINHEVYVYVDLLLESALFMLTTTLRRILVDNLFNDIADAEMWRSRMRIWEHRYKDEGGVEPKKQRAR